jgi:hypothetical protein
MKRVQTAALDEKFQLHRAASEQLAADHAQTDAHAYAICI